MKDIYELKNKKLFLLDMDGTLYLGDDLFAGTKDFLRCVRSRGGNYLYLTNNSSKSVEAYVEKLTGLGIVAKKEDFLTSVDALILYLRANGGERKRCYVCGTQSMKAQLAAAGLTVTEERDSADTLLVGFDTELTFRKLEDACFLLGRGVDFIATNPDWVCPTGWGYVPDCGSVCEMLYRATGRKPYVIGKPRPDMVRLAMEREGCAAEETVLVGDRLYTDIASGVHAGIDTVLVLSGESTEADTAQSEVQPTWVLPDIGSILKMIRD